MRYVYSTIKYVPYPASGEFVNIGIIAGSDESNLWAVRMVENKTRALSFGSKETLSAVVSYLDDPDNWPDEYMSEEAIQKLHDYKRNILQFGEPLPIVADTPEDAIMVVWPHIIHEH